MKGNLFAAKVIFDKRHKVWNEFLVYGIILIIIILLMLIFSLISPQFFTAGNLLNLLRQLAPNLIAACGMTYVIAAGGIDLSIGSLVALTGVLLALAARHIANGIAIVFCGVALGLISGALNGYLIVFGNIPAFIVTLGSMAILRGIALVLTKGFSIPIDPEHQMIFLGRGWFVGLPVPALIALVVVFVMGVFFNLTPYGTYTAGIGSNEEATRRAGINVKALKFSLYCMNGMLAALAGIVLAARVGTGSSYVGQGFELSVITAVILGGTPLVGGEARLLGTIFGCWLLGLIGNGLVMAKVSPYFTQIAEGSILLLSILANRQVRIKLQQILKI